MSASYELPFGATKLVDFGNKWMNRGLGGWVVNSIYTWELGAPLGPWGNLIYYGGNLHLDQRGVGGTSFDTTRFNTNTQQQLTDNVRTFSTQFSNLRSDGANNIDLSLIKNTRLHDLINVQLRFESFNAFNHTEFSAPSLVATSSAFGRITSQNNLSRTVQIAARLVW